MVLLLVGVHLRNNVVAAVAEMILAKLAIFQQRAAALTVCRIRLQPVSSGTSRQMLVQSQGRREKWMRPGLSGKRNFGT